MEVDNIGIDHLYDSAKDIHWYHVGYHPADAYGQFYNWLASRPIRYDMSDMPHHCFVLLYEEDRLAMHEAWDKHILPVEEGEFHPNRYHDSMAPVDKTSLEYFLFEALKNAIQEEMISGILKESK